MEFSPIRTDRLIIRKFRPDDYRALYNYLSDPNVVKYEPYEPYTMEETKREAEFRSRSDEFYAVTLRQNSMLIGNLYLANRNYDSMELGFVFNYFVQGNGYATEAASALLDYAFDKLNARRIIAECDARNERSRKLMERLGMRREGDFKQNIFFKRDAKGNPIWQDTLQYAILKDEWQK